MNRRSIVDAAFLLPEFVIGVADLGHQLLQLYVDNYYTGKYIDGLYSEANPGVMKALEWS
jgi:hypothetical protein